MTHPEVATKVPPPSGPPGCDNPKQRAQVQVEAMEVQVQQLSPVLMEFSVTVETDRVKKEMDRAFGDLQKRARVQGFRPGKAPRDVLAHLYGGAVLNDVASKLVDETLNQALAEKNVQPL